jgi:hypothetical protein
LVLVDLNNLPGGGRADAEAVSYRVMLRALSESRAQLGAIEPSLAEAIEAIYRRAADKTDPFLSQSALREALLSFQESDLRLVLVLDPFDAFCCTAPVHVLDSMRGLRDSFKSTLSYLVGLRQELAALRDPAEIGELYEILDTHQCWVGAMDTEDARWVVGQVQEATGHDFSPSVVERLIVLSGGHPSLLRAASLWLATMPISRDDEGWTESLLAERSMQHRLGEIWNGLTREDHQALIAIRDLQRSLPAERPSTLAERHMSVVPRLESAGLCQRVGNRWHVRGTLMSHYVDGVAGGEADPIWVDDRTGELYQGQKRLANLSPLERELLLFLVDHPQVRHSKTDLILNAWPDDPCPLERSDDSVYQVVRGLRAKIEPNPAKPRHIITWRGTGGQEGGYQFYPQGRGSGPK